MSRDNKYFLKMSYNDNFYYRNIYRKQQLDYKVIKFRRYIWWKYLTMYYHFKLK